MFKYATLFALLAGSVFATTITSVDVSAGAIDFASSPPLHSQQCSYHGPDSHTCSAQAINAGATASVSVGFTSTSTFPKFTSVSVSAGGFHSAGASGTGSISTDDIYNIDDAFPGPIFGAFTFSCGQTPGDMSAYSIQGGPLQICPEYATLAGPGGIPPAMVQSGTSLVPITVVNGQAEVTYFVTATVRNSSDFEGLYAYSSLALTGFQDSLGNPVAATLTPEPASWTFAASGLLLVSWKRRKARLKRFHERKT